MGEDYPQIPQKATNCNDSAVIENCSILFIIFSCSSMLDLSDSSISNTDMQALMNTMYKTAGLPQNADIDFESFAKIFASDEYESTLKKATLGIEGKETLR